MLSPKLLLFVVSNVSFTLSLWTITVKLLPSLLSPLRSPSTWHLLPPTPFPPPLALAQALALILNLSRLMEHTQCAKQHAEWFCVSVFLFPHKAWCSAISTWCGAMPSRTWRNKCRIFEWTLPNMGSYLPARLLWPLTFFPQILVICVFYTKYCAGTRDTGKGTVRW